MTIIGVGTAVADGSRFIIAIGGSEKCRDIVIIMFLISHFTIHKTNILF